MKKLKIILGLSLIIILIFNLNNKSKYNDSATYIEGIIDKYQAKTYSFGTKNGESLYTSREINYQVSEEVYGNRILNTKINLTKYQNNYPYNFDVPSTPLSQQNEFPSVHRMHRA